MRNVVLVEIFAVVEGFQPELAKGFALRIRADNSIKTDEAGEADTVESLGVKYGGGVSDTLSHVYTRLTPASQRSEGIDAY